MEWVSFWSDIFQNHAAFLYILLDVPNLKEDAFRQYLNWFNLNNVDNLPYLVEDLKQLKLAILDLTPSGEHLNLYLNQKDFRDLVHHMLEELEFFQDSSMMTPISELGFWVHEAAEHTEFAGKQLNNKELIELSSAIRGYANDPPILFTLLDQANQLAQAKLEQPYILPQLNPENIIGIEARMRSNFASPDFGSTIFVLDQMLLEHEAKEGEFGLHRLQQLFS